MGDVLGEQMNEAGMTVEEGIEKLELNNGKIIAKFGEVKRTDFTLTITTIGI